MQENEKMKINKTYVAELTVLILYLLLWIYLICKM